MKEDTLSIVIAIAAFAFAGVRLYMKYAKKKEGEKKGTPTGGSFPLNKKDDDYEPYSGK